MKTKDIIEEVQRTGTLEVSRNSTKSYVLRKQCKRLMDNGVLCLVRTSVTSFFFEKAQPTL